MTATSALPSLRIEIHKRSDGGAVLHCTRADGSVTWQRFEGNRGRFFPWHDLTHYAVESTLDTTEGFFGLIAQGWDIGDTGGKGARGRLPPQAVYVEHLVGLVERGGIGRTPLTAAEIVEQLHEPSRRNGFPLEPAVTDARLTEIRARIDALHDAWAQLETGDTLSLVFPGE